MTIADAFNVGHEFKLPTDRTGPDGLPVFDTIKLRKPTLYEQGEFQRWLEQRTHDAIDRGTEAEDKKDRRHDRVYADSAMGKYEWDGPLALEAMWSPAGLAKIVAITCRDQGVTDAKAEEIVGHAIREVAAKVLTRASTDPKALAPVLEALGFPMDWFSSEPSASSSGNSSTHPSTEPSPNSEGAPTTNSCSSTTSSEAPMG